jgi:hypothetical protein
MDSETFVDGEWYVLIGNGRGRSHFYQRYGGEGTYARASCGPSYHLSVLQPSDDERSDKAHKINPRRRCRTCWRAELSKARRG